MADYLRNRPFLVVTFIHRPAQNVNTGQKGWQNITGSLQTFEQVAFVDRINDITKYGVAIDIINSKMLRNNTGRSDDEIITAYFGKYRNDVSKALTIWAQREAQRLGKDELEVLDEAGKEAEIAEAKGSDA